MIEQIGLMTAKEQQAKDITDNIKESFARLLTPDSRLPAIYLIWKNPYMTAGGNTFIHSMLVKCGFINVFANRQRYPEITIKQIKMLHPEILLLSSEPFPFTQKHIDELAPLLPNTKIILADGEMFSWYGSHLLKACAYFEELMHFTWL
jgi:ABC-type Fe3+-hydroxamate transport system substrate-binding protein